MKNVLSLQAVSLFVHLVCNATGQGPPPLPNWTTDRSFSVSWRVEENDDSGSVFSLVVHQSYSAVHRKIRWDIREQYSYVIWSLNDEKLDYTFPFNYLGSTLNVAVYKPFEMDTKANGSGLSIVHPDLSEFVPYHADPPFYTWVYNGQSFQTQVVVKQIPDEIPEIVSVQTFERNKPPTITHFFDYVYLEPEENLWVNNGDARISFNGSKVGDSPVENLVRDYLLGDASIWPDSAPMHHYIYEIPKATYLRSTLVNHETPFPYEQSYYDNYRFPPRLNWMNCGAVSYVKNQGGCNACSTFIAISVLESAHFIHTNERVDLAVQAALDCAWYEGNSGCLNGKPENIFNWAVNNGGVPRTENYGGFRHMMGKCTVDSDWRNLAAKVYSWTKIPYSVNALKMVLLFHGPVVAGVDPHDLATYDTNRDEGIIRIPGNRSRSIHHAGQIVGFDTSPSGVPYWIVKNSWGKDWGFNGYYRVEISEEKNPLLLLDEMTYVNMDHNSRRWDTYCPMCKCNL